MLNRQSNLARKEVDFMKTSGKGKANPLDKLQNLDIEDLDRASDQDL